MWCCSVDSAHDWPTTAPARRTANASRGLHGTSSSRWPARVSDEHVSFRHDLIDSWRRSTAIRPALGASSRIGRGKTRVARLLPFSDPRRPWESYVDGVESLPRQSAGRPSMPSQKRRRPYDSSSTSATPVAPRLLDRGPHGEVPLPRPGDPLAVSIDWRVGWSIGSAGSSLPAYCHRHT